MKGAFNTHASALKWLCLILCLKAIAFFWFLQYTQIGLGPDEAQYWTWSQALDWGYYSKPPGIAWQIAAGTQLFGNTVLGVRFFSILMAFALSIVTYALAAACRCLPKTCFWAGVAMALSPLGLLNSYLAITDVGLVVFWGIACAIIASALATNRIPKFYLLGFVILLGALFKWPIYFFWVFVVGLCYWHRDWLNRKLIVGIGISLLGLLPSIIWNSSHQWATFRHVGSTMAGGSGNASQVAMKGNFFEFMGAQVLLVSPIFFVLLVLALVRILKKDNRPNEALLFSGITCLIPLVGFSLYSLFYKTQGNWCDYIYPGGFVLMAWYACEQMKRGTRWLYGGAALSLGLTVLVFNLPLPYKMNPFKSNLGWPELASALGKQGYDSQEHFLFSDRYQTSSLLSFYANKQKRAYFLNLNGIRLNQFSFWPSLADEQQGKNGYFVLVENEAKAEKLDEYKEKLQKYFSQVEYLGAQPLIEEKGKPVKNAYFFFCTKYNGSLPLDSNLY